MPFAGIRRSMPECDCDLGPRWYCDPPLTLTEANSGLVGAVCAIGPTSVDGDWKNRLKSRAVGLGDGPSHDSRRSRVGGEMGMRLCTGGGRRIGW